MEGRMMLTAFKKTAVSWEIRRALRGLRDTRERVLERRFYEHLIAKHAEGCIIDVGANVGSKTELFRNLAPAVVAIEPDPTSSRLLRTRFRWRSDVIVLQCAIADKAGTLLLYQFGDGSAYNTADPEWAKSMMDGSNHMHVRLPRPKEINVPARTIAEIEAEFRPVKYLKIDAEGFEKKVISTLRYPIPLISMEFNFPQMQDALMACVSHLETIGGYRFNAAITEPPIRLEHDEWLSGGEIIASIRSAGWKYTELFARLTVLGPKLL
jgi:FkbM family methyltransferase